eukprot:ANDGO_00102.mRNA.1 Adenylate cyclase
MKSTASFDSEYSLSAASGLLGSSLRSSSTGKLSLEIRLYHIARWLVSAKDPVPLGVLSFVIWLLDVLFFSMLLLDPERVGWYEPANGAFISMYAYTIDFSRVLSYEIMFTCIVGLWMLIGCAIVLLLTVVGSSLKIENVHEWGRSWAFGAKWTVLVLSRVLLVPISLLALAPFRCADSSSTVEYFPSVQCYATSNVVLITFSGLLLVQVVAFSGFIDLFFVDAEIQRGNFLSLQHATFSGKLRGLYLFAKVLALLVTIIPIDIGFLRFCVFACCTVLLWKSIHQLPFRCPAVNSQYITAFLFCTSLSFFSFLASVSRASFGIFVTACVFAVLLPLLGPLHVARKKVQIQQLAIHVSCVFPGLADPEGFTLPESLDLLEQEELARWVKPQLLPMMIQHFLFSKRETSSRSSRVLPSPRRCQQPVGGLDAADTPRSDGCTSAASLDSLDEQIDDVQEAVRRVTLTSWVLREVSRQRNKDWCFVVAHSLTLMWRCVDEENQMPAMLHRAKNLLSDADPLSKGTVSRFALYTAHAVLQKVSHLGQSDSVLMMMQLNVVRAMEHEYLRNVHKFWDFLARREAMQGGDRECNRNIASLAKLLSSISACRENIRKGYRDMLRSFPRSVRLLRSIAAYEWYVNGSYDEFRGYYALADKCEDDASQKRSSKSARRNPAGRNSRMDSYASRRRPPVDIEDDTIKPKSSGVLDQKNAAGTGSRNGIGQNRDSVSSVDIIRSPGVRFPGSSSLAQLTAFASSPLARNETDLNSNMDGDQETSVTDTMSENESVSSFGSSSYKSSEILHGDASAEYYPKPFLASPAAKRDKGIVFLRLAFISAIILFLCATIVSVVVISMDMQVQHTAIANAKDAGTIHLVSVSAGLYSRRYWRALIESNNETAKIDRANFHKGQLRNSMDLMEALSSGLYRKDMGSTTSASWNDKAKLEVVEYFSTLENGNLTRTRRSLWQHAVAYVANGRQVGKTSYLASFNLSSTYEFRYEVDNSYFFEEGFPELTAAYRDEGIHVGDNSRTVLIASTTCVLLLSICFAGSVFVYAGRKVLEDRKKRFELFLKLPKSVTSNMKQNYAAMSKTQNREADDPDLEGVDGGLGMGGGAGGGGLGDSDSNSLHSASSKRQGSVVGAGASSSIASHSKHREISQMRKLTLLFFLLCAFFVLTQVILLVMGLDLNVKLTLSSREVVLSCQRTAFAHRLSFLLTELMLGSQNDRYTAGEIKTLIRETLQRVMDLHFALVQGSSAHGVPGSASRSGRHYHILYEAQCSDLAQVYCLSLEDLLTIIRTNTEALLTANPSTYGRNNALYRNVLKVDDDVIYHFESKHPTFMQAIDVYVDDTSSTTSTVSTTLWVILAISTVVWLASYPFILRPCVNGLDRECTCVVDVLSMVPEFGILACPDVHHFFETGNFDMKLTDQVLLSESALAADASKVDSTAVNIGWTLMKQCPDAAILFWNTFTVEALNPAACALLGIADHSPHFHDRGMAGSSSSLVGKSVLSILEESSRNEFRSSFSEFSFNTARTPSMQTGSLQSLVPSTGASSGSRMWELQIVHSSGSILQASFCIGTPLTISGGKSVYLAVVHDVTRIKQQEYLLKREKERAETMLYQMIPKVFAQRIRNGETRIADQMESVTVLFADLCGFTSMSAKQTPSQTVEMLDTLFTKFDMLCETHGVLKVKSIGDCIMVACGVYREPDHVVRCLRFGHGLLAAIQEYNASHSASLQMRVGMATGPVIVGIIGAKMPILDLFSDTVNLASRMESTGVPGRIQIARPSYEQVATHPDFTFEEREVNVKGKGVLSTYLAISNSS